MDLRYKIFFFGSNCNLRFIVTVRIMIFNTTKGLRHGGIQYLYSLYIQVSPSWCPSQCIVFESLAESTRIIYIKISIYRYICGCECVCVLVWVCECMYVCVCLSEYMYVRVSVCLFVSLSCMCDTHDCKWIVSTILIFNSVSCLISIAWSSYQYYHVFYHQFCIISLFCTHVISFFCANVIREVKHFVWYNLRPQLALFHSWFTRISR